MYESLSCYAGRRALEIIRENGLTPEMIKVVAGAAGGPKWLVLSRLDKVLFGSWLRSAKRPIYLVGSSIGSWRFAVASQKNPTAAIDRFENEYIHQTYGLNPGRDEIDRETDRIQDAILPEHSIREILDHPYHRLNILAVRCRRLTGTDNRVLLGAGLGVAMGFNLITRKTLGMFFERTLFSDSRDIPPFFDMNEFPIKKTPLTPDNLKKAVLASGSIPVVMSGVKNIPGASKGTYRDGGVIDYHLDLPLLKEDGVALFPHFMERLIPGWFDKRLTWRKPGRENMKNVLMIAPSSDFVSRLPSGKIPDRKDFEIFNGRNDERIAAWKKTTAECDRLGEEFLSAVETGAIRDLVKPLDLL